MAEQKAIQSGLLTISPDFKVTTWNLFLFPINQYIEFLAYPQRPSFSSGTSYQYHCQLSPLVVETFFIYLCYDQFNAYFLALVILSGISHPFHFSYTLRNSIIHQESPRDLGLPKLGHLHPIMYECPPSSLPLSVT
jgi:hypothetical protein